MEENIKEVKDKILKFTDDENFSEAVKTFWAWKEKNPKITDSQSADLHILAAKNFMRYCKQNDSWDEMNKLFGGQKSSEKTPENQAAAAEAKNSKQKNESEKSSVVDIKNSSIAVDVADFESKDKEEFIKSLELKDCGNGWKVSKLIKNPITNDLFWTYNDAEYYISKLNNKYTEVLFAFPTVEVLMSYLGLSSTPSDLLGFNFLCINDNSLPRVLVGGNMHVHQYSHKKDKTYSLCLAVKFL